MAFIKANDPTKYYITPIHSIQVGINSGNDIYMNLEEGSTFAFTSIKRPNDTGGERIIGFKFEGTFIVVQNDYTNFVDAMDRMVKYKPSDFDLVMQPGYATSATTSLGSGRDSAQPQGAQLWLSMDTKQGQSAPYVKDWHATFDIDHTNNLAPKFKLNIKGIFSTDILTKCDIFSLTV